VLILDCLFDDVKRDDLRRVQTFLTDKSNGFIGRFFKYAVDVATLALALPGSRKVSLILTTWKITEQQGKQILAISVADRKELSLEIAMIVMRTMPTDREEAYYNTNDFVSAAMDRKGVLEEITAVLRRRLAERPGIEDFVIEQIAEQCIWAMPNGFMVGDQPEFRTAWRDALVATQHESEQPLDISFTVLRSPKINAFVMSPFAKSTYSGVVFCHESMLDVKLFLAAHSHSSEDRFKPMAMAVAALFDLWLRKELFSDLHLSAESSDAVRLGMDFKMIPVTEDSIKREVAAALFVEFLMLHEIGHIRCGHLEPSAPDGHALSQRERFDCEYQADEYAMRTLIRHSPSWSVNNWKGAIYPLLMTYAIGELFLVTQAELLDRRHPLLVYRVRRLLELFSRELDPDGNVLSSINHTIKCAPSDDVIRAFRSRYFVEHERFHLGDWHDKER
jgi:hypothetical protein